MELMKPGTTRKSIVGASSHALKQTTGGMSQKAMRLAETGAPIAVKFSGGSLVSSPVHSDGEEALTPTPGNHITMF